MLQFIPLSLSSHNTLNQFIQSSLIQGHIGAQAQEDLMYTQAAEQVRAVRQGGQRCVLQRAGVLYARNAQKAVKMKEDNELLEAQATVRRAQAKVYSEKKRTWNPIFKELKVQIKARAYLYKRWTFIHKALHHQVKHIE